MEVGFSGGRQLNDQDFSQRQEVTGGRTLVVQST